MKKTKKKNIYLYVFVLALLIFNGCGGIFTPQNRPKAVNGVLDLRSWHFGEKGPVPLNGEWIFEWQNLATPGIGQKIEQGSKQFFIKVPSSWNGHNSGGQKISGNGYATYRLKILLGASAEPLGFKFLDVSSAAVFYVNGKIIMTSGVVGKTALKTTPKYTPQVVYYMPNSKVLEVVAVVSNFNHRLGGIWESVSFGRYKDLSRIRQLNLYLSFFLLGSIIVMAFYHLGFYVLRTRSIITLYFSLFCFFIALRGMTTGERGLLYLFPDINWDLLQRLIYLSFYLAAPAFAMYVRSLFPAEISRRLTRMFGAISVIFSGSVLILSPRLFSYTIPFYQVFTLSLFIYGLYGVIQAVRKKRQSATIFLVGFLIVFAATVNDILYSRHIISSKYLVPFGLFIFIFFQSFLLLMRFSKAFSTVEVQGDRLKEANESYAVEINNRMKVEHELRESKAKYEQLLQSVPAGIYEFDLNRLRFTNVNNVMCDTTGYSVEEFLALDPTKLLEDEGRRQMARLGVEVRAGSENPAPVELKIITKSGKTFWAQIHTRNYFENGVPVKARSVAYDMTTLKRAEEEKKELEKKLVQAQKMESIGTLAGGIAHDFNNLLMGIQGNASLLLYDAGMGVDQREQLKAIENYSQRGVDLTAQLLGLARGGKYDAKPTAPNTLIENCAKLFARTRKEVALGFRLAKNIKMISVDRGQIEQVLLNLLINAWQAMENGGDIIVATENVDLDEGFVKSFEICAGSFVMISVSDTGIGMDVETQQRVFDPFFTTKEIGRGTGLGLASAYGIIKNHGGIITLNSTPGRGSQFDIYLPASGSTVVDEEAPSDRLVMGNQQILLIDDEKMILDVGTKMLTRLGYGVLSAGSGKEALEIYQKQPDDIDMVILDMIMPGQSGGEVFDELKALKSDIKVLLASGYSLDGNAQEIMARGCSGFIQKPFKLAPLSQKINQILAKTPQS
jgi:two-component system, cell cycle sensor histidine kinase and response regulator CckA